MVGIKIHVLDIFDRFACGASDVVFSGLTAERLVKNFRETLVDAREIKINTHVIILNMHTLRQDSVTGFSLRPF